MNDLPTLPSLTDDQVLQLALAERRGQQPPPCFVCGQTVLDPTLTLGPGGEEKRMLVVAPCGHRMTYNANTAKRKYSEADQLIAAEQAGHGAATEATELHRLRAQVAAARKYAAEMRDFCSPHGVSVDYADQLEAAMDRAKEGR